MKKADKSGKFWKFYFLMLLGVIVFFCLIKVGLFGRLPDIDELENPKSKLASELISQDGEVLGKYYLQNRTNISYDQLSESTTNALIATEDERFREHSGIDWRSIARAIKGAGSDGGGSTITQQLAKNLFHVEDRRPSSKIGRVFQKFKEWIIAIQLERRYTKDEIIVMYLNTVEFSGHSFGIKAAAKEFFNKEPKELGYLESATLIGLLQATSRYNPKRNPVFSKERRNVVLGQMVRSKYLTEVQFDELKLKETKLDYQGFMNTDLMASYLKDVIGNKLKEWCKTHKKPNGDAYNIFKDGLKIYTTVDSKLQRYAEESVVKHIKDYQKLFYSTIGNTAPWRDDEWRVIDSFAERRILQTPRYKNLKSYFNKNTDSIHYYLHIKKQEMTLFGWNGDIDTMMTPIDSLKYYRKFLHAGFVGVEPTTGQVKFWVGGINHNVFKYDHVSNTRQSGSTFKPFVYALAIDNGISPCTQISNNPISLPMGNGKRWNPKNSGGKAGGAMNMYRGLGHSVNLVVVHLMLMMGQNTTKNLVNFIHKMGVKGRGLTPNLAMCLGTEDVSPLEMASAYTTFANKGFWIEPTFISRIEDKSGNVIADFHPNVINQVLTEEKASVMIDLLKGPVLFGTAKSFKSRFNLTGEFAGKTGTTDQNADAWFMGVTRNLVTATWVGATDRAVRFRSTGYGQGARMAMPIYGYFMQKVLADSKSGVSVEPFDKFEGEESVITKCETVGGPGVIFDPEPDFNVFED